MRFKGLLLFSFLLTIVVVPVFAQYEGGDNDGSSATAFCVTTLNGVDQFSFGGLTGSSTFCDFSTESYTLNANNPPQGIQYIWSAPGASTILTGQNTPTVNIAFDNTPGMVSVTVVTICGATTFNLPVTNGACSMYQGGDNDGHSEGNSCSTTLDGGPLIVIDPNIAGSTTFCEGATESYSLQVANAPSNTYYDWSVPPGAIVSSGQGTNVIIVTFGSVPGNVSVNVVTDCSTTNRTLAVTSTDCTFYAGGDNDGFSKGPSCATDLNGGPVFSVTGITGSSTFCEFGSEGFSVVTVNPPADIYYDWSVPADAAIVSGQGTPDIVVLFGNTNGSVGVNVITDCAVVTPAAFPVTATVCLFYAGGDNDGFSNTLHCATTLDGSDALAIGPIVGSTTFCDFATESYTIAIDGATPETTITWNVPAGAAIVSGQGTATILVAFANTDGNVTVNVVNPCTALNATLPVLTTSCIFYAGGGNDGFSTVQQCASNLDGGPVFTTGPIIGSSASCEFSTEAYSITVTNAPPNLSYAWTVPAGATIVSGQGTASVLVAFGNTSGSVAVTITTDCDVRNVPLAVSVANCIFYAGGNNDGFSVVTVTNIPLPIALVSFDADVKDGTVYLKWETSSEVENDFFLIERSKDGKTFEALTKVEGAGTSHGPLKYQARDSNPYHGTSYYRLSQTDYDGATEYFRVLIVKVETFAEVTKLYPNPVSKNDLLHIDYFAEEDGQVKISIINPAGLSTDSKMIDVKSGVNLFEFAPHFQTSGVHVIIIRSREKAQALRLVVL